MRKEFLSACVVALFAGLASAQVARPPASESLLNHLHQSVVQWDRAAATGSPAAGALDAFEFLNVRRQFRELGTAAYPIAPRIAAQLLATQRNQFVLAYMLADMTPTLPDGELDAALRQTASGDRAEQILAIARLGKAQVQPAVDQLTQIARSDDMPIRLMAVVALGYVGKYAAEPAARTLGSKLSDQAKAVRSAAANGLRLIGPSAAVVAPELLEYLRSRDNVFYAVEALQALPVSALRPAKADLEALLGDPKIASILKRQVADLLVRLERANDGGGLDL